MPIETVIETSQKLVINKVPDSTQNLMEQYFDDLRDAQALVDEYLNKRKDDDDEDYDEEVDVLTFKTNIMTLKRQFKDTVAIMSSSEGNDSIDKFLRAYEGSLDGRNIPRKFCTQWQKILKKKVSSI